MIAIDKMRMTIDESMRRWGTTDVRLDLSVSDRTPFFDREYDPLERWGYKVSLHGYGRDGTPSRQEATRIAQFGQTIHERRMVCSPRFIPGGRARIVCEWVLQTQVLETQRFQRLGGDSTENVAHLLASTSVTVPVDDLDVDGAAVFFFNGRELVYPRADSIFCRVQVIDLHASSADEVHVTEGESNTLSGYFGSNESLRARGLPASG